MAHQKIVDALADIVLIANIDKGHCHGWGPRKEKIKGLRGLAITVNIQLLYSFDRTPPHRVRGSKGSMVLES